MVFPFYYEVLLGISYGSSWCKIYKWAAFNLFEKINYLKYTQLVRDFDSNRKSRSVISDFCTRHPTMWSCCCLLASSSTSLWTWYVSGGGNVLMEGRENDKLIITFLRKQLSCNLLFFHSLNYFDFDSINIDNVL